MNKQNILFGVGLVVVIIVGIIGAERLSRKLDAMKMQRDLAASAAAAAAAAAASNPNTAA